MKPRPEYREWVRASSSFATFKPKSPVKGVEACETRFIAHMVFDKIKELEFNAFFQTLKSKIGDALVSWCNFDPVLKVQRDAIVAGRAEIEKLVDASDFEQALVKAKLLDPDVTSYIVDADKENKKFADRGNQYNKRLKDAKDKAAEAMKISKELQSDPQFLQHLPIEPRNELLATLQKPPFTDDKKKAAKVLLSVKYLEPGFEKRNQEIADKLATRLKADPEYKSARENWQSDSFGTPGDTPTKATARRLKILQKAVDAYVDVFQIKNLAPEPNKYNPPTVVPKEPKLAFPDQTLTLGEYNHSGKIKKIEMNVHETAFKQQNFENALESVIHETGHHQQSMLADRLKKEPKMSPSDPDFIQAQSFKLNDPSGGFYVFPPDPPPSPGKGDEYFSQPEENHSRITSAIVASAGIGK